MTTSFVGSHLLLTTISAAADDEQDRVARLEKRIAALEAKLARAEHPRRVDRRKSERGSRSGVGTGQVTKPSATVTAVTKSEAEAGGQQQGSVSTVSGPAPAQRDVTPSEFNVFRDNAATLSSQKFELSVGASYEKRNSLLQKDRAVPTYATLRYGLLDGIELSATVPYFYSQRDTDVGIGRSIGREISGLGDVSAQVNALLFQETPDYPGLVATVGAAFPTGESPFSFGPAFRIGFNPIDPFRSYQSRGDYAAFGNMQVYKTLDPVIVFAGIGVNYGFPQTIDGYHIDYQPRLTYNMGFAFAVNEKLTLGFQISGAEEPSFKVNKIVVKGTAQEPIVARLVVVQRIAQDTYLEPNVGFGLTPDAPDVSVGFTLRRRF